MIRLIDANALYKKVDDLENATAAEWGWQELCDGISQAKAMIADAPSIPITGDTSDGYHTFNELYHHRAVLFSVIVKMFPNRAWKARQHYDGSMFDGMFIVGIETPDGLATYHYDLDPYWDMFKCRELEFAPEWDGHTAEQAIERIGKLEPTRTHGYWIEMRWSDTGKNAGFKCSVCGLGARKRFAYCHCGAVMDGAEDHA